MAEKSQRSGGRVSYDVLNNLSSVDLIYDDKRKKKTSQKKSLGIYQAERLIARKQTVLHWTFCDIQLAVSLE